MTCPHHTDSDNAERTAHDGTEAEPRAADRRIDRRAFLKSALVIGGAGALSSVAGVYGMPETASAAGDRLGAAARENRQHAWDGFETVTSEGGVSAHPAHHVTLHLNYAGEGTPTPKERATVERAFRSLERHFAGEDEGLLFTIGYAPAYFDRFAEDLPFGLDPDADITKPGLLRPQTLIDTPGVTLDHEKPRADAAEICLHLASNHVQNVLAAEELLWGGTVELDGETVSFEDTVADILTTAGDGVGKPTTFPFRRVGFAGHETVTRNLDEDTDFDPDQIPDDAELMMGFNDLYRNSIPREDNATILEDQNLVVPHPPGVFAQGTIQHVSKLEIDLGRFYDEQDTDGRRRRMFSPDHDAENTGTVGENLGDSNAPGDTPMRDASAGTDKARQTTADYRDKGVAGHAQKLSRARFSLEARLTDEGVQRLSGGDREELLPAEEADDALAGHDGAQELEQVVLRRDVTTTDGETPGNLFIALMRFNPYVAYIRQAMNGVTFDSAAFGLTGDEAIEHESIGAGPNSGIVNYLETTHRGNYLVPPLTLRSLPHPRGQDIDISVSRAGSNYRVRTDDVTADDLATGTIRFGWFYDVNRARGTEPRQVVQKGDRTTFVFPAEGTGIASAPGDAADEVRVRFAAKRADTGRPVRGTATVPK